MKIKQTLIALSFLLSTNLLAKSDTDIVMRGIDLNDAVFRCAMDAGSCITFLFESVLGKTKEPINTNNDFCKNYYVSWCEGLPGGYPSGFEKCREVKQQFHKKQLQKQNKWNLETALDKHSHRYTEYGYFKELEETLTPWRGTPIYTCNAKEQRLWLHLKCNGSQASRDYHFVDGYEYDENRTPAQWAKMKTRNCFRSENGCYN